MSPTVSTGVSTRERLLASTTELLAEGGYAAASVASITGRTGVAAGTLYRHFESKEELFVEVFKRLSGREVEAMRVAGGGEGAPIERLSAAIEAFARRALAEPRVAWALLAEPVDAGVDEARLEYRVRYRDLVAGLIDDAVESGEIPPCDATVMSAAIVGGVGEALVGPLSSGTVDREALISELVTFTRNAIGAPKPSSASS